VAPKHATAPAPSAGKQPALPRVSRLLDALATDNHLNLLQPGDRKQLADFLKHTEKSAPVVHISFATDPSSAFTAKIVTWLRASIAPDVLLEVGLQPTIAAGAILRTTNKVFDLSLRERFSDSDAVLLEALEKEAADVSPLPNIPTATQSTVPTPAVQAAVPAAPAPSAAPATAAPVVPQPAAAKPLVGGIPDPQPTAPPAAVAAAAAATPSAPITEEAKEREVAFIGKFAEEGAGVQLPEGVAE
jgi:hypothetical protein